MDTSLIWRLPWFHCLSSKMNSVFLSIQCSIRHGEEREGGREEAGSSVPDGDPRQTDLQGVEVPSTHETRECELK